MDSVRGVVAPNSRLNGWSIRRKCRGRQRGSGNRQIYNLVRSHCPRAREIGPRGAYIECLREVEKFQSSCVRSADEHWNLYMNSLRTPPLSGRYAHAFSFQEKDVVKSISQRRKT